MANVGANFNGSIFRKDFSCVIATNRHTAVMLPVALRYNSSGVQAGTALARNTTDGLYDTWANGGASGTGTAACILFESHDASDWTDQASSGAIMAVGIFGGCTVYKGAVPNYASGVLTGLSGRVVTDASGVDTILF
jgi:hypothetical protein